MLFFSACQDATRIGKSTLLSSDQRDVILNDTFSITAHTVRIFDTVAMNTNQQASAIFAGSYNDPSFGQINARGYFQMLPSSSITLADGGKLDTVILRLRYNYPYGCRNFRQVFNVYRIRDAQDSLNRSKSYYSTSNSGYDPTVLASFTLSTSDSSSGYITLVATKNDTSTGLARLAQDILNKGSDFVSPDNRNAFADFFRGFVLAPADTNANANIIAIDISSSYTRLNLYYSVGGTRQPVYQLVTATAIPHYTHFGFNFGKSGIAFAPIINQKPLDSISEANTNHLTYFCPLLGIVTRYSIPELPNLVKKVGGKIAITRAELLIKNTNFDTSVNVNIYPSPQLMVTYTNPGIINGISQGFSTVFNSDNTNISTAALTFDQNFSDYSYNLPITRHLASVISGAIKNTGFYLSYRNVNGYSSPYYYFSRSVFKANTGNSADAVKLRLFYIRLE